jgi:hypothetical protein
MNLGMNARASSKGMSLRSVVGMALATAREDYYQPRSTRIRHAWLIVLPRG